MLIQQHMKYGMRKANSATVPWIVWGFFKIITPFIDPVTREKLKFNEDMKQYVPAEQLWSADWGGDLDFEYDHGVYWAALNDKCRQRREEKIKRWEAGGKEIGELEEYLAGGTDTSVKGLKYGGSDAAAPVDAGVVDVQEKLAETTLDETKSESPVVAA